MSAALTRTTGSALVLVVLVSILGEWGLGVAASALQPAVALGLVILLTPQVRRGRQAFVAVAAALTAALAFREPGWMSAATAGLRGAAFIAAFYCALASLRSVAERSPAIREAGRFLTGQPPGRRYIALTFGGQPFALVLNYGAIALLGGLAAGSVTSEPDPVIRRHRTRRMLLAFQRGFASVLPWSPLSFAVVLTTVLVPGTSRATIALPGVVTGLLMAGSGWLLDALFAPKLAGPPPAWHAPEGSWFSMTPLAILLCTLLASVGILNVLTGIRVVGLVLLVVPVVAASWAAAQRGAAAGHGRTPGLRDWARAHVLGELPGASGKIVLLMMAGYIGTVGSALLVPILEASRFDLSGIPAPVVLLTLVWIIPAAGQIGMNPILAATLLLPLVPSAELLGIAPSAIAVAATAGWALTGVTSPFTAVTILVGEFGGVPPRHVGLVWNRSYFLIAATILSSWVLAYARYLA